MPRTARIGEDYTRDCLTGLAGPDGAHVTLDGWQTVAADRGEIAPVHAMLLSLDRFDTVNLAFGQAAGDSALIVIAGRIQHFAEDELEGGDWLVARLGGGKFLLAAREACSRDRWHWLAEALADAIALPIPEAGSSNAMRLWPRIALMRPMPGESSDLIVDRLAETLERAKGQHGRRLIWADGRLTIPGKRSAMVEADLLNAIDRDEITIWFQPQIDLANERVIGAEALARWQHPELGRIGAGQMFAIAERTDHVAQLSRHIAQKALLAAAQWPGHFGLSINITPADLAASNFADELLRLVETSAFDPLRLTVEITEHVLVSDLEAVARHLSRLRDAGVKVALDDFGAGFCNFRYLKLLPLDAIKLDRAMIDGIEDDAKDLAVFRAIIAMAGALDLKVVVEGIETVEQRDIVRREKANAYQGYLRARPMGTRDFASFLRG